MSWESREQRELGANRDQRRSQGLFLNMLSSFSIRGPSAGEYIPFTISVSWRRVIRTSIAGFRASLNADDKGMLRPIFLTRAFLLAITLFRKRVSILCPFSAQVSFTLVNSFGVLVNPQRTAFVD